MILTEKLIKRSLDTQTRIRKELIRKLDMLEQSKDDELISKIIDVYAEFVSIDDIKQVCDEEEYIQELKSLEKIIDQKFYILFDALIDKEDVDSIDIVLKCKAGTIQKGDIYKDIKKRYREKTEPDSTSPYKHFIIKQYPDIVYVGKLMELHGKLDKLQRPTSCKGIYYSKKFRKHLESAFTGEYGPLRAYLYADGKFGHLDADKEICIKTHDYAYHYTSTDEKLI